MNYLINYDNVSTRNLNKLHVLRYKLHLLWVPFNMFDVIWEGAFENKYSWTYEDLKALAFHD